MSLIQPLPQPVKGILDSRLAVGDASYFPVLKGASSINTTTYSATSTGTNTISVAASLNPNLVYSRRMLLQIDLQLKMNFTNTNVAAGQPLNGDTFALRQFPLASMIQDARVQMGTQNFSISCADLIHPLQWCSGKSDDWRRSLSSTTTSQPDRRQRYADYAGSPDSPFTTVNGVAQNYEVSRGAFPMLLTNPTLAAVAAPVDPASTGDAIFSVQLSEPIFLSPFSFASDADAKGFCGLSQLYFNFTMLQNWARIFSYNGVALPAGFTLNSFTPTFTSAPRLVITGLTPPVDFAIPRSINWDWMDASTYTPSGMSPVPWTPANFTGAVPTKNVTWTSSVMQFPTVPWKIMIYARTAKSILQGPGVLPIMAHTDSFLPMCRASINFNNVPNQLSNLSQQSLYQISQANGYSGSYNDWIGYTRAAYVSPSPASPIIGLAGGILIVDCVKDLGASLTGSAPGVAGNFTFQVQADFYNTSGANIANAEMIVVPIYRGVMNITEGVVTTRTACITDKDIIDAETSLIPYHEGMGYLGGGFWDTLKSFAPLARTIVNGASSLLSASGHGFTGGGAGAGATAGSLEGRYRRR